MSTPILLEAVGVEKRYEEASPCSQGSISGCEPTRCIR